MLKLTRSLTLTWGDAVKVLPVTRLVGTKKLRALLGTPASPATLVASESAELILRASVSDVTDLYEAVAGSGPTSPVPLAAVRIGGADVSAMVKEAELDERTISVVLLRVLLLRMSIDDLDLDDEWEKDTEHSYSRDYTMVTAMRPKQQQPLSL